MRTSKLNATCQIYGQIMHRSRALCALSFSLLISTPALAAGQDDKAAPHGAAKVTTKKQTARNAEETEQLEVKGRRTSTIASSATKTELPRVYRRVKLSEDEPYGREEEDIAIFA